MPHRKRSGIQVLEAHQSDGTTPQAYPPSPTSQLGEESLRLAFKALDAGLWEWDLVTNSESRSERFFQLLAIEPGEVAANHGAFLDLVHPDDRTALGEAQRSHLEERTPYNVEIRLRTKSGEYRWFRHRGHAKWDEAGRPLRMAGTIEDTTTRHRDLAGERAEHKRLEQKYALLSETQQRRAGEGLAAAHPLIAALSHELRNPLGALSPSLYIIRKRANPNDARFVKALERMERGVARLGCIIEEFLHVTGRLERQPTQIDEWLERTLEGLQVPEGFCVHWEPGLPQVALPIDRDRLGRAVLKACKNACQTMSAGGSTRKEPETHLAVRTRATSQGYELQIAGTASDVPPSDVPELHALLQDAQSTGVGPDLTIAKHVLEQHGGGIAAQTGDDRGGVRILLWLPPASGSGAG